MPQRTLQLWLWLRSPAARHILPFAAWILFLAAGAPAAYKYALRTVVCALLLMACRPWRWYPRLAVRHLPLAVGAGILACGLWILPEWAGLGGWPQAQELYLRFGIMPLGKLPVWPVPSPYHPDICGWTLTLTRLAGSALVIAVIEEFFWRGWLYRWLIGHDFLQVQAREFEWRPFLLVCLFFGLEHDRWLVGIGAGAIYGGLVLRTGCLWCAVVAHVVTNLCLGLYVIATDSYRFW